MTWQELLVPKEMYDEEDAIIEVVPGAGNYLIPFILLIH